MCYVRAPLSDILLAALVQSAGAVAVSRPVSDLRLAALVVVLARIAPSEWPRGVVFVLCGVGGILPYRAGDFEAGGVSELQHVSPYYAYGKREMDRGNYLYRLGGEFYA